ncbi:MAG: hypothetical protein JST82_05255 [Bacteroidetes bacterium]|nr:hypothetical protein [Bacteroidota bacterium]
MRYILLLVFSGITCIANAQKLLSEDERMRMSDSIKTEALMLYKSERASWFGTDVFLQNYTGSRDSIDGYFSYSQGNTSTCVFYSKSETPKVIGTIKFDQIIAAVNPEYSSAERDFTSLEKEYYQLMKTARNMIMTDTNIRHYKNTNFNPVCLIDDKRKDVYLLTGTNESGVVLFGNDYLYRFDRQNNLVKSMRLHMSLIEMRYPSEEKNTVGMMHNHLPEFSPFITATDICTAMLYKDLTHEDHYTVVSEKYFSVWNCETMNLAIVPLPKSKK